MNDLITVFRMTEISVETRIKIMKALGTAINYQYAAYATEPLVYELVLALDPTNPIKDDEHYLRYVKAL